MDVRLHCAEAGAGEVLILLHGNGEDSTYFVHQIPFLAKHFRVLAVDSRGHGRSPRGGGALSIEGFADDLADFMDERGIARAHLLGFSDGANVAMAFALRRPERVRKLILNGGNLNPWGMKPGVLLTDDPGAARWFAALPGSCDDTALNSGRPYLQILHLSHSHGSGMALLPEEHTLWALGADLPSLCRAIALGMGSAEGRWGDWLAVPMEVRGGTGILDPEGQPHWLQIGPDGALWAVDPWADAAPAAGLAALAAPAGCSPGRTDWNTLVLCAAMAALRGGRLSMEGWYYAGIAHYLNQWGHEQDIVPRPPVCVIGRAGELGGAVPADNAAPAEYGLALAQQAAALQQRLAQPDAGPLETTLALRLAQLAKK